MTEKTCALCFLKKSVEHFTKNSSKASGLSSRCRPCQAISSRAKYLKKHPLARRHVIGGVPCEERYRIERVALRDEVVRRYGGRCVCCEESEPIFLTVDHVRGNGGDHRRELGNNGGNAFYRWLRNKGFPQGDYQILCMNCNWGRWRAGGSCPHTKAPVLRREGAVMAFLRKPGVARPPQNAFGGPQDAPGASKWPLR